MSGAAATEFVWVPKAAAIAQEAGARLREFLAQGVETEYKGDVDLVTVADRTAEKLIRARLSEAFPAHGIYGEEGTRDRLEGDPYRLLTAMAHGVPVVAADGGAHIETVGEDGMLFAAGDINAAARSLVALSDDIDLRRRVGGRLRDRQQRSFSLPRHVETLEGLYRQVIAETAGRGR